ncbi:MAG: protease pro-enzyme activation domain-containing protein [Actinomycetales bacterium]
MGNSLKQHSRLARILAFGAATACAVTLGSTTAMAAPPSPDTSFPGAVPSWAKTANDQGAAAADTTVEGEIFLPLRDAKGAEAFAQAVSSPDNRAYKQWLSPQQWIARFAPTKADSDAVVAQLTSMGLTISAVPDSRQYVVFRGTADQVNKAMATQLHNYSVGGKTLVGPSTAPSLPVAIAGKVSGVTIDSSRFMTHPDSKKQGDDNSSAGVKPSTSQVDAAAPDKSATVSTQCSTYFGQYIAAIPAAYGKTTAPTFICGYTPQQLQSAYGLGDVKGVHSDNRGNHGNAADGKGQTVAIIDAYASPTMLADVNQFSRDNNLPQMNSSSYREISATPSQFVDQAACGFPSGWQGEEALDVDSVHGLAPGANILYAGAFNCGAGIDVAMSKILDNKLANIVSNSYGNVGEALPADAIKGQVNIHLQAAGEGIGLYYSSGDNGDENARLGYTSPDFPASSPWATSVGGTSLAVDKRGNYQFETGWGGILDKIVTNPDGSKSYTSPLPGTTYGGGAGGGVSAVFDQPFYQRGVVPNSLAQGKRVSPDVSSLADPYTGYTIGLSPINDDSTLSTDPYTTVTYGGTSLASPLTAAQVAVAQQVTGQVLGFANPVLYQVAKDSPKVFNDVRPLAQQPVLAYTSRTSGNQYLLTMDHDTSLVTAKGYDDVTGVGSMSYRLAAALADHGHGHGGGHGNND